MVYKKRPVATSWAKALRELRGKSPQINPKEIKKDPPKILRNVELESHRELVKIFLSKARLRNIINFFDASVGTYDLRKTGYTTEVIVPGMYDNSGQLLQMGKKYFFANSVMSKKAFVAYTMIKRDITASNIIIDQVPRFSINYYAFKHFEGTVKQCSAIDISAAYPNVLLKTGLITQQTFNYMMTLKKEDRLKCTGLLATQKMEYKIKDKSTTQLIINENPLANYFYYLCFMVGELMHKVYQEFKDQCYLYWVDGIFVKEEIKQHVFDLIKNEYPCKIESVNNLRFSKHGNYLLYRKDEKLKVLPVPRKRKVDSEVILSFLS